MAVKTLPSNLPVAGLLSARPTATGSKALYYATDVAGGTLFVDTAAGTWKPAVATLLDDPIYSTHGVQPSSFRYLKAALARVRAGTGDARLASQGDSIAGLGTLTTSYMARAARLLALALGVTARMGYVPTYFASAVQAQWGGVLPSGWSASLTYLGSSFQLLNAAAGASTPLVFTPTDDAGASIQGDQFVVYLHSSGGAAAQYAIDGGSYATVPAASDTSYPGVRRHVIPAMTRGTHTLSIKPGAGSAVYVAGAELIDSQTRGIRYLCGGTPGTVAPATYNVTETPGAVRSFQPDLMMPEWNTNEYSTQVALSTAATNWGNTMADIKAWTPKCDVMWLAQFPQGGAALTIPQQAYYDTLDAAGDANGVPVLHPDRVIGSYAIGNPAPMSIYGDVIHPSDPAGLNFLGACIAAPLKLL